jgi:hypothetical protein
VADSARAESAADLMTERVGEVEVGMTVSLSVPVSLAVPHSSIGVGAWRIVKVDTAGGLIPL